MSTTNAAPSSPATGNRWLILAGGVLVQLSIGAVYAWSTMSRALQAEESNWDITGVQAATPFTVVIGMLFVGTFLGGRIQDKRGPRVVALSGVVIYSIGTIIAGFTRDISDLWLLILGYGVLGGFGLGLAYIVPIAMLQKWFPDKRGLITGLAVGGFGFGAVITSPMMNRLISGIEGYQQEPTRAFLWLGIAYLIAGALGASVFRNPPEGYTVAGAAKAGAAKAAAPPAGRDFTQQEAMRTPQWYLLTLVLTVSVTAGISLISVAADAATDIAGFSVAAAATLVGIMGLFNGGGRILWAAVSDKIGRRSAFIGILGLQGLALIAIPHASNVVLFYLLAAIVYTCYGGAFGTLPATAGDFFGVKNAGAIYGLMLIGWSIGGIIGPLLITWLIGEDQAYTLGFTVMGAIALVGVILPIIARPPKHAETHPAAERRGDPVTE